MATYAELFDQRAHSALRNKITVAVAIKAQSLIDSESPTAAQIAWANDAIRDPEGKAVVLLNYVLAANKSATVQQIQSASDAAIQNNVDTAVDALIAGGA